MLNFHLAQAAGGDYYWLVYVMFLLAGLLVGGAWSTYKNGAKTLTIILAIMAAMAAAAGVLWMVGELQG